MGSRFRQLLAQLIRWFRREHLRIERIRIDGRFDSFDGPKSIKVEGEIVGMVDPEKKVYGTWRSGTSDVITVPFSVHNGRQFAAFDVLESNGRRALVFREILPANKAMATVSPHN